MKQCKKCTNNLPIKTFTISKKESDGLDKYCRNCKNEWHKKYTKLLKKECFIAYGGVLCACCKVPKFIEFLTLDHVKNDGAQERRQRGRRITGYQFYRWLRVRKFPNKERYQVLCWDCNGAKGTYGICPHQILTNGE